MKRDVTITARKNSSGQIEFDMTEGNGPDTEILVFNKTKDNIPKSEFYEVVFKLENKQGANLAFVQDVDNVMHVAQGSGKHLPKCDKATSGPSKNGQLEVTSVTASELKVTNKDEDECFYKFVLHFVDQTNGSAVAFDPIWGNQNGGGGGGGISSMIASSTDSMLGGAASGLLATWLFNPQAPVMTYVWVVVVGGIVGIAASMLFGRRSGGTVRSAQYA